MLISETCFKYQNKYARRYGPNTIIFIQKGTFYETYATDDEGPDLHILSDMLSCKVTRTNTKKNVPVSRAVPYMLGIPVVAIHRYLSILLENNYTVVLYDEVIEDGIIERKISGLYTKGIGLEKKETSYLLSIYLVEEKQLKSNPMLACGIALIEISTGQSIIHEAHSSITNENLAIEEIRLIIAYYQPKEIIINYQGTATSDSILRNLDLKKDDSVRFIRYPDEKFILTADFFKISYQNKYLESIYDITNSKLSTVEQLGIEKKIYAIIALMVLLEYVKDHNKFLVSHMEHPENFMRDKNLVLGNNAVEQLHLLQTHLESYGKIRSLLDILDETSTPMGKKFLKESLLHPLSQENKNEIISRYDWIEWMIKKGRHETVRSNLKNILDLEVLHRRMTMGILTPRDFFKLDTYYKSIKKIFKFIDPKLRSRIFTDKMLAKFKDYRTEYLKLFSVEKMSQFHKLNEIENIFKKGVYKKLDKLQIKVNYFFTVINQLKTKFNEMVGGTDVNCFITLRSTKKLGYHFCLSSGKAKDLEKMLTGKIKLVSNDGEVITMTADDIQFNHNGKQSKIIINTLADYDEDVVILQSDLYHEVKSIYSGHLHTFVSTYKNMFNKLIYAVSYIDFITSGAIVANAYSYKRPIIKSAENIPSYIKCKGLRNPLIERINSETEYITHNISLGNIDNNNGLLLYGLNSSGKSSLMKAVGMVVSMAQIGYFASVSKMEYEPYMGIYARITGSDNPFKGLSSFELEMSELQTIIKQSRINGDRILIIGDEVCRGTEIVSGTSIVASALMVLSEMKSSFIFASHLHQLVELDEIKNLTNIKISHLLVSYDNKTDSLVYDRLLRDGCGPTDYGLQVAKHRIKDDKFLKNAESIKKKLYKLNLKTSKYNNDLIVDQCHICQYRPVKKHDQDLETHHIHFQKDCYKNKIIAKPHMSMNHLANLLVVCRVCHQKIHKNKIIIDGFKETSNGKKLQYKIT